MIGKRKKLLQDMADNSIIELRAALTQEMGVHKGTRCITSDASPIVGRLYRHNALVGFDICESEYMKLPKRRGDASPSASIQDTFLAFTGEEAAQVRDELPALPPSLLPVQISHSLTSSLLSLFPTPLPNLTQS